MGETSHGSPPSQADASPSSPPGRSGRPHPPPQHHRPHWGGTAPAGAPPSQPRPGRGARSPGQGQCQHRLTSPRKANATTPSTDDEQTQRRSWKTPCPAQDPPPLPASDTGGSGDNLEATPVPPAHCPPAGKEACAVAPAGSLTALGCCAWPPGLQRPGLSLARPRAAAATPPPHSCRVDKLENSECLSPEFGIASGFPATLGDLDHVNSF